jgi:hypothetical protein
MANAITTTADPVQLARLAKALDELQRYTGRNCFQSVMFAAQKISQSARAYAKPGERMRPVTRNPAFTMSKRRKALMQWDKFAGYPFMFPVYTQARGLRWWYTFNRNDPKRAVPRHGLSKIMWNNLASAASEMKEGGSGRKGSKFTELLSYTDPNVSIAKITNLLSYEEAAYPGITNVAVTNGVNALNYQINKAVGVTVNRANRP